MARLSAGRHRDSHTVVHLRVWVLLLALLAAPTAQGAEKSAPEPELRAMLRAAINDSSSFKDRFVAEVWLLDMSNRLRKRIPDDAERLELLRSVHAEASYAGLAPELVLAVIEVESNFDRFAISRSGARGLMQVMPFWLKEIGRPDDNLFHLQTNLRMGCTILRYYLEREDGNLHKALARYNGSAGKRTYPEKVFSALSQRWFQQ